MKINLHHIKQTIGSAILVVSSIWLSGCATPTSSSDVKPLTAHNMVLDLSKYRIATIVPFDSHDEGVKDVSIGETFAKDLAWRLKNSYGPIFSQIDQGPPGDRADELIVTGKFTKFDPGSRAVRGAVGLGLGASSLDGSLILKNASDQRIIYQGEFSKLWAWGGLLGGARGIEDMEAASVAAVANTIAIARGWTPPVSNADGHSKYATYRASLAPLRTNRARIWIYRPPHTAGHAFAFTVRLDGTYVGSAVNGGFFCLDVEPGRHEISDVILPDIKSAYVDVGDGNEAFVAVSFKFGFWAPEPLAPEVVPVSKAAEEIAECQLKGN